MGPRISDNQIRQALGALVGAVVAGAAAYGYDLSLLNDPWVTTLLFGAVSVVVSLLIPDRNREPSLTDAYRAIEVAKQAREMERWAQSHDPERLRQPDEFQRTE